MRRTLAFTALMLAAPLFAQAPPNRTLPKNPTFKTGESPDAPSPLATKLRSDFASANAAAQAALSRLKAQAVPKPLTQEQKLGLAAHAAGVDKPCDRTLFKVEGAAANFTIQPGQLILLNGCFKGSSNAEVRIEGNFPDGRLLLEVQDRGDGYFYGKVPDITGVLDQPVSVCVRFLSDGFKTAPRNGFFYAKRQTWDVTVDASRLPRAEGSEDAGRLAVHSAPEQRRSRNVRRRMGISPRHLVIRATGQRLPAYEVLVEGRDELQRDGPQTHDTSGREVVRRRLDRLRNRAT